MSSDDQHAPEVSVVLAVRDAGTRIIESARSVLAQRVPLELVLVDDGSSDDTPQHLDGLAASDRRVRVLRQAPLGLTAALVAGCAAARGRHIARLDAGDRMLPGRLDAQLDVMRRHPDTAVLAGGVRFLGPRGELLSEPEAIPGTDDIECLGPRLRDPRRPQASGIAHMSVMFPRERYQHCGGYREDFRLAQDVDLWLRLSECGEVRRERAIRTESVIALDALSPRHHATQRRLRAAAVGAARARRSGRDERPHLARARTLGERATAASPAPSWRTAYFVGACLEGRDDLHGAARYYRMALEHAPLQPRPRLKLLRLALRGGFRS